MSETQDFLSALFGKQLPNRLRIQLWQKDGRRSHYFHSPEKAAEFAAANPNDCYVAVSLAAKDYGPARRGPAIEAAGIPGLWADIDVNGGPDKKNTAAPDFKTAAKLAASVLEPTLTVNSGYGLQAWWLFDEGPWLFGSPEEREQGARMAAGWIALLRSRAEALGFTIDAVQDLARLMRLPGTVNCKGGLEAACVGWPDPVAAQDGPVYDLPALAEAAKEGEPLATAVREVLEGRVGEFEIRPEASPDFTKMEALIANDPMFAKTWKHERRDAAASNWSLSEYDLSLASKAAQAGWSDQEIADLIVAHRRKHNDTSGKAHRPDYIRSTIGRARRDQQEAEDEAEVDQGLENLAAMGKQHTVDHVSVMSEFNKVLKTGAKVKVKDLFQDGEDPQNARYRLVLENGKDVPIGKPSTLFNPDQFREAFGVVTGHVIPLIKRQEWLEALQAVLAVRQVTVAQDDTREGIVVEWLERYIGERAINDQTEAARRRDPFEKEAHVYVFAASFTTFVNRSLGRRIGEADVKQMLKAAGFTAKTVAFETEQGRKTSRSYYHAPKSVIE